MAAAIDNDALYRSAAVAESQLGAGTTMFFTLPRSSPDEASLQERGAEANGAESAPTALERR